MRLIYFIPLVLYSSCVNNNTEKDPLSCFETVKTIVGTELITFDDYNVLAPGCFAVCDSCVYVQNKDGNMLCCIDLHKKTVETIFRKGHGPNEFINLSYANFANDVLSMVECNKCVLVEVAMIGKVPARVTYTDITRKYGPYTSVIRCKDAIIASGLFDEGRYMFHKISDTLTEPRFFGKYRFDNEYESMNSTDKKLLYICTKLAVKPDLSKFVSINFTNGVIDINAIRNDSIINEVKLDFHYHTLQQLNRGTKNAQYNYTAENRNGFYDVAVTDDLIFTIYSGKTFESGIHDVSNCEYIMIFDWNGNPQACYRTEQSLQAICFSDHVLYGLTTGEQSTLLKFDILCSNDFVF